LAFAIACENAQLVIDEIKAYLERARTVRYGRSGQASRSHVERDVPGVVDPRTQGQPNFADNLRPQVKSNGRVLPLGKRQSWP